MSATALPIRDTTRFAVGLAGERSEILEAQRLRYLVFAQEMGARLPTAHRGIDEDEFDRHCDHLVVRDRLSGAVVGTYRILPPESAGSSGGLYSDREFDLTLPRSRCATGWWKWAAPACTPPSAAPRSCCSCGRRSPAT